MADYMTLLGAEDVKHAASRMASAAEDMQRAANAINESVDRLVRALNDHAMRTKPLPEVTYDR